MSEATPDQEKYPNRYTMCDGGFVYKKDDPVGYDAAQPTYNDAQQYLQGWHNKGYTGDYVPEALREDSEQEDCEECKQYLEECKFDEGGLMPAPSGILYTAPLGTDWDVLGWVDNLESSAREQEAEVDAAYETRATDPRTGGQKGRKLEEFALVPVWPRQEVARVYGMGAKKYEPNNWRRGYAWSWSISAAYRHLAKFEAGESIDPESGLHHLAHVEFHMNTLMEFERLELGTDDRQL